MRPAMSQVHAKRLRDLGQGAAFAGMGVTPLSPSLQLVQNLYPGFRASVTRKLVPQVFHQLQAFKFAEVLDGLQSGFHA